MTKGKLMQASTMKANLKKEIYKVLLGEYKTVLAVY